MKTRKIYAVVWLTVGIILIGSSITCMTIKQDNGLFFGLLGIIGILISAINSEILWHSGK